MAGCGTAAVAPDIGERTKMFGTGCEKLCIIVMQNKSWKLSGEISSCEALSPVETF